MPCNRSFELDLAGFLGNPSAPEFADFQRHAEECADCEQELRAWRELDRELRRSGSTPSASHPTEEQLLQFGERPHAMSHAERESIEQHVLACLTCKDELATLRSFDFGALGSGERGKERSAGRFPIWAGLRGLVLHPAFAYGLLVLILLPTAVEYLRRPEHAASYSTRTDAFAERGAPAAPKAKPSVEPERIARLRPPQAEPGAGRVSEPTGPNRGATRGAERGVVAPGGRREVPLHDEPRPLHEDVLGPVAKTSREGRDTAAATSALKPSGGREAQPAAGGVAPAEPEAHGRNGEMAAVEAGQAAARAPAEPAEQRREFDLRETNEVDASEVPGETVLLKVPVPADMPTGRELELRVISPATRRELRKRFFHTGESVVEMSVPRNWLRPGAYTTEIVVLTDEERKRAASMSFRAR